jgi:hypothetical protein
MVTNHQQLANQKPTKSDICSNQRQPKKVEYQKPTKLKETKLYCSYQKPANQNSQRIEIIETLDQQGGFLESDGQYPIKQR